MEAIQLTDDLSKGVGDPFLMFRSSSTPWYEWDGLMYDQYGARYNTVEDHKQLSDKQLPGYVIDGPHLHTTPNGSLLCLLTTYRDDKYIETQLISRTGNIEGPWEQLPPLDYNDKGHAMIFESFEGETLLIMHNNMSGGMDGNGGAVRGEIFDMAITDEGFKVLGHRSDLDGVQNVSTDDTLAPLLFNSADKFVSVYNGEDSAKVPFTAQAIDDHNFDIDVKYSIAPNSSFKVGTTKVTISAQDDSGNKSSDSFNVNVIDKTSLKNTLANAQDIKADGYTDKSFAALQDVLFNSQLVFDETHSTQAAVDKANEALLQAIENLVKEDDSNEPGGNEPGGNEPGGNEPGGNEPGGNEPGGNEPGDNKPGEPTATGDSNVLSIALLSLMAVSFGGLLIARKRSRI